MYNLRNIKEKRQSSSFVYILIKRASCVCDSMDDGSKYWSFDVCHEWFHPECLGFSITESAPDPFMCQSCLSKTSMRKTGGKSMETKNTTDKKVLIVLWSFADQQFTGLNLIQ